MSTFFEALEQAKRERAFQGPTAPPAAGARQAPRATAPRMAEVRLELAPVAARPELSNAIDEHLVSLLRPSSFEAEHYRTLRHLIEQARRTTGVKVIGISSPARRDGKTLTAINLAGALAQAPRARVLLVDLDLRNPAVLSQLALDEGEDDLLEEALLNPQLTLDQLVRPCPPFNLALLASRRAVNAPYELLKSPRCGELLAVAREHYDYVVLDLPPLIPLPDCRIVEKWVDAFLVVVATHKTSRKALEDALAVVDRAKVASLVFNGDEGPLAGHGYGPPRAGTGWWHRTVARGRQLHGRRFRATPTRFFTGS